MLSEKDPVENIAVSIDARHHMIHEGKYFFMSDIDYDVDILVPKLWLVRIANTDKKVHFGSLLGTNKPGLIELYKTPTLTSDGTPLAVQNAFMDSPKTAETLIFKDPTVTADGTFVVALPIGAGEKKNAFGGVVRTESELILAKGADFLVKFTADVDDTRVVLNSELYEVEHEN